MNLKTPQHPPFANRINSLCSAHGETWAARIRSLKTDNNLVLFRTDMKSGHGGKSGRFAQIDETAREYAFAIAVTADDGHGLGAETDARTS